MKKLAIAVTISALGVAFGTTASAEKPSCSWGQLTSSAIAGGFPQGAHSSDPGGDGKGGADQPRAGLANVVSQGDLNATCELIGSLLP